MCLGALLMAGACNDDAPPPSSSLAPAGWANTPRSSSDSVVARVEGHPIFASDVAAQARRTGGDKAAALDTLIDLEVLANRARTEGLEPTANIERTLRETMVSRFIAETFERKTRPEDMSDEDLRGYYEHMRSVYDHPRRLEVVFWLVPTAPEASKASLAPVRRQLEALRQRFVGERAGLSSIEDELALFSRLATSEEAQALGVTLRKSWVDEDVNEWTTQVLRLQAPGALGSVVHRAIGLAVPLAVEVQEERRTSFEEAKPELRALFHPRWQAQAFADLTNRLAQKAGVRVSERPLQQMLEP